MCSFKKDEGVFRFPRYSSVLDNWSEQRKVALELKRKKAAGELPVDSFDWRDIIPLVKARLFVENRGWPFDWDWNGLFCHDFRLLDLPDTVLIETLQLLNNYARLDISMTCQKLRNLILDEGMDRRPYVYGHLYMSGKWAKIKYADYADADYRYEEVIDFAQFEAFVNTKSSLFVFNDLTIRAGVRLKTGISPKTFASLEEILQVLWNANMSYKVTINCSHSPKDRIVQSLEAFFSYDYVKAILVDESNKRWPEYCTTVTRWAESQSFDLKRTRRGRGKNFWSFKKSVTEKGARVINVVDNVDGVEYPDVVPYAERFRSDSELTEDRWDMEEGGEKEEEEERSECCQKDGEDKEEDEQVAG